MAQVNLNIELDIHVGGKANISTDFVENGMLIGGTAKETRAKVLADILIEETIKLINYDLKQLKEHRRDQLKTIVDNQERELKL